MGVSGSGKTLIGQLLSKQVNLPFYDADDFHPKANIIKMKSGHPLNDHDRQNWLEILNDKLITCSKSTGAILACSALKEKYRQQLSSQVDHVHWVYLDGTYELIRSRLENRKDHFMKADLLKSQFHDLEIPDYAIKVDIRLFPQEMADKIRAELNILS
ncbi:gluconokinase [Fulvivirga sp. M361]|nr:gluconokinase [Fulvivirga sp. M361]